MTFLRILAAVAALFIALPLAQAHDYKIGELTLEHPWTRATPPGARVAGGYVRIVNTGATADRLIGGSFVASERVEVHEMSMQNDVMQMRRIDGLDIPAGATVTLEPGGLHLMFMGLKASLTENAVVKGTLVFEKAGTIEVEFAVEAMGARGGDDHSGHHHSGHDMKTN